MILVEPLKDRAFGFLHRACFQELFVLLLDPVRFARYQHVRNLFTLRIHAIFWAICQILPDLLSFRVTLQGRIVIIKLFVASEVVESVHTFFHVFYL